MNREMDGQLTIRDEAESTSHRRGRTGPGHHFTRGSVLLMATSSAMPNGNISAAFGNLWSCFFQTVRCKILLSQCSWSPPDGGDTNGGDEYHLSQVIRRY